MSTPRMKPHPWNTRNAMSVHAGEPLRHFRFECLRGFQSSVRHLLSVQDNLLATKIDAEGRLEALQRRRHPDPVMLVELAAIVCECRAKLASTKADIQHYEQCIAKLEAKMEHRTHAPAWMSNPKPIR